MITTKQLRTKKIAGCINLVTGLLWVVIAVRNYQRPYPTDWRFDSAVASLFFFGSALTFWQLRRNAPGPSTS